MWDTIKDTREERVEHEKLFKEIMAWDFPNLMKTLTVHIQEA